MHRMKLYRYVPLCRPYIRLLVDHKLIYLPLDLSGIYVCSIYLLLCFLSFLQYDNLRSQATLMKERFEGRVGELEQEVEKVESEKQRTVDRARQAHTNIQVLLASVIKKVSSVTPCIFIPILDIKHLI